MSNSFDSAVESIALRLCDDAYVAWLQAEADALRALRAWSEEKARTRVAAYLCYQAALDREEAAARDLERLLGLARWSRHGCETARAEVAADRRSGDPRSSTLRDSTGGSILRKGEPWPVP